MVEKDSFEPFKKAFLIGLGATVVMGERVNDLVNELVERGEMSQKDAKSFADDLKQRAMKEKEAMESKMKESVDTYVKQAVKSLGLVSREEFEAFKKEMGGKSSNGSKKPSTKK